MHCISSVSAVGVKSPDKFSLPLNSRCTFANVSGGALQDRRRMHHSTCDLNP
jgi:hypothetical protein